MLKNYVLKSILGYILMWVIVYVMYSFITITLVNPFLIFFDIGGRVAIIALTTIFVVLAISIHSDAIEIKKG